MGQQTYPSTTLLPVQVLQDLIDGRAGSLRLSKADIAGLNLLAWNELRLPFLELLLT